MTYGDYAVRTLKGVESANTGQLCGDWGQLSIVVNGFTKTQWTKLIHSIQIHTSTESRGLNKPGDEVGIARIRWTNWEMWYMCGAQDFKFLEAIVTGTHPQQWRK